MTDTRRSDVLRRLGDELRVLREKAGLTAEQAAHCAGVLAGTVVQWEKGRHATSEPHVLILLDAYGASDATRESVLALVESADRLRGSDHVQPRLPERVRTRIQHERRATTIRAFCPTLVPAWLQTRSYAKTVLTESRTVPTWDVHAWVEVWQSRAAILSRPRPPQMSIVLAEHAVSPVIADPVMVAQQARHLLDRATWPRVEVRVLPTAAYASTGIVTPFVLMDFVEAESLVHVGDELADRVVRDVGEVAWFDDQFQQLAKLSRELSDSRVVTTGGRTP